MRIYIYIYIQRERERERQRIKSTGLVKAEVSGLRGFAGLTLYRV